MDCEFSDEVSKFIYLFFTKEILFTKMHFSSRRTNNFIRFAMRKWKNYPNRFELISKFLTTHKPNEIAST